VAAAGPWRPRQDPSKEKGEKDLGRSEEKIEQGNIPNGLW